MRGWIYRDIIFSLLTIFGEGVIILWHAIFTPDNIWSGVMISWHHILTPDNIGEGVIISWHYILTPGNIWWGADYIVTLHYHSWHYPRIWHWRWLYLNIFTIQIWHCSDTRVLLFISIYSPHETWGVEVIIFEHGTLFAVETWWIC